MKTQAGVEKTERACFARCIGGDEIPAETCSCRVATAVTPSLPE
jgi:hypothetical protein